MSVAFDTPCNFYAAFKKGNKAVVTTEPLVSGVTRYTFEDDIEHMITLTGADGAKYSIESATASEPDLTGEKNAEYSFSDGVHTVEYVDAASASHYVMLRFEGLDVGKAYQLVIDTTDIQEVADNAGGTYTLEGHGSDGKQTTIVATTALSKETGIKAYAFTALSDYVWLTIRPEAGKNFKFNAIYVNQSHTTEHTALYKQTGTYSGTEVLEMPAYATVDIAQVCDINNVVSAYDVIRGGVYHAYTDDAMLVIDTRVKVSTTSYGYLPNSNGVYANRHVRCVLEANKDGTYTVVPQVLLSSNWVNMSLKMHYQCIAEF